MPWLGHPYELTDFWRPDDGKISQYTVAVHYATPFEEGRAYCFAAVCWSTQFPFIFSTLDAHFEMIFGIQIYHKNI
jgi:hypothetical protein